MEAADLTQADRDKITKLLSHPIAFPTEFKDWLGDWLARNMPPIPVDQLQGFVHTRAQYANNPSGVSVTTNVYFSAAPGITGLPAGKYLVLWGYTGLMGTSGGARLNMSMVVNADSPSDSTAAYSVHGNDTEMTAARARFVELTQTSNTLQAYYRRTDVGGSPSFSICDDCWLVALRVS
jgi:hypothetical protein